MFIKGTNPVHGLDAMQTLAKSLATHTAPTEMLATNENEPRVTRLRAKQAPPPRRQYLKDVLAQFGVQTLEPVPRAAQKRHAEPVLCAEPKKSKPSYEWRDLDAEDLDDPLMVLEYVLDIFAHLYQLEQQRLPDPHYLARQTHVKPKMRSIVVDWLVEMHQRFRLLPETFYLAINIMDRFMLKELVQVEKLQLLATGLLFLAGKTEEVFSPLVKNYAYFTDGTFNEEEILQAEKYMLTTLDFEVNYANPMNFLRRISKADDYDVQLRTLGKYLLEITFVDHHFIGMRPLLCAAALMYIARAVLQKSPVWTGNLIHYLGGYFVADLRECAELIFQYLVAPVEHDEFFKKYAARKYMKASVVCRAWAKRFAAEKRNLFDDALATTSAS